MIRHTCLLRFVAVFVMMFGTLSAHADLIGPGGGGIDPGSDFVDNGFFGTYGAVTPLAADDGMGQLQTAVEVAAPVRFAEPGGDGDVLWFFPEVQFGGAGQLEQITGDTTVRLTTTLNLENSDPFNIWNATIYADSVDYSDGTGLDDANAAVWLDSGLEVTFGGVPVNNVNAILSNDDMSLLLAFDEVSGTGVFSVTMYYRSIGNIPVTNPDGTGNPPGGMSFNYLEMNAASGDTSPGIWSVDAAGLWNSSRNWGPGGPPHTSATAQFGDVISQDRTVVVNEDVVAAGVRFESSNRYVVAGPGTVTIESDLGFPSVIEVVQGQHEFQAKVSLSNESEIVTTNANDRIDFNNTVALNGNLATVSGPGTVSFNNKAQVATSAPMGDFNNDGSVDAADYSFWRDTDSSAALYDVWKNNFGATGGGALGMVVNHGRVSGSGRIAASLVNEVGGIVEPGRSAGVLIVDGNFTQDDLSTLRIELGGTATGDYDVLEVGGSADVNGNLAIALIAGFSPTAGDNFDVLTASSVTNGGLSLSGDSGGFGLSIIAGGHGQILRLSYNGISNAAAVPEPSTGMLSLVGLGAALAFRRKRRAPSDRPIRRMMRSTRLVVCAWLAATVLSGGAVFAQPTLINFSANLLPDEEAEGVMPDQLGIAVAGLSGDGTLNVINFPPAGGNDIYTFIPARAGEEDVVPDHTAGPGDPGDNPFIFSWSHGALLFEDPGFPGFGVLDQLKVSSLWVARATWAGASGSIVGLYENQERWRVPVNTGPIPYVEGQPEFAYIEIFTPQGSGDGVNELQFEGDFPAIDDITIGLTGLPPTPTGSLTWIAGGFGMANDLGVWAPSALPSTSTALSFGGPDFERLVITDGGLTAKSMSFDHEGSTLFLGAGTVTLDANTNDPTIDVLSGDVEFQARVNLVDSLTIDVAAGSSVVFNNVLDLGGNDLTITPGSNVVFNNMVILGGGAISGSFELGAAAMLFTSLTVPEPTTFAILVMASFILPFVGVHRRRC